MENYFFGLKYSSLADGSKKITFFDYLFVLILIIYAGRANTFVESNSITGNPVATLLPVVLSGILAFRRKIKYDGYFFILIFCFGIYFIAISLKYGEIHPTFFLDYLFKFFIVYTTIKAFKNDLFKIYVYLLYIFSLIGLFFWGIQTILGGDTLYFYLGKIPGIDLFSNVTGNGYSALIYSVQSSLYSFISFPIPRNCGYAQEPGSFAVYLCLAIFINLFITSSDEKSKKYFWIFVIALLSTQSTTGYIIFMLIIVFHILNKNLSKILLLLPFVIVSIIYASTLPFMSNKIFDLINETKELDQMISSTIGREQSATPQRFSSFLITFKDFRNNPILGLGPDGSRAWTNKIGAMISPISGIGNILSQFGLVGFLFFIISSFKSSIFFSKYFNYNGKLLLFLIILLISVSYGIITQPLVMCFWMFYLFAPNIMLKEKEQTLRQKNKPDLSKFNLHQN